jgi:hypothetical protein
MISPRSTLAGNSVKFRAMFAAVDSIMLPPCMFFLPSGKIRLLDGSAWKKGLNFESAVKKTYLTFLGLTVVSTSVYAGFVV